MKELSIKKKNVTMMSLDEAIKHCKEKSCGNNACALEHEQLSEWLNELKELRSHTTRKKSIKDSNFYLKSVKTHDDKLIEYINEERNKKGFYFNGEKISWNEIPLNVRKHDYPYYFKGELDCFPFKV